MNSHLHHSAKKGQHSASKMGITQEEIKLPRRHKDPFVKSESFFKKYDTHLLQKTIIFISIYSSLPKKLLPPKQLWWIIDAEKKTKPDPQIELVGERGTILLISIVLWLPIIYYTYMRDKLSLNITIAVLMVQLITFYLYDIIRMQLFSFVVDQDGDMWLTKTDTGPEYSVIKHAKDINLGNMSLLWDPDKFEKFAKARDMKLTSLVELMDSSNYVQDKDPRERNMRLSIPYYMVTMLVTLGLICIRLGRRIFYAILPLIIYITLITIPMLLLWHWSFYNVQQVARDRDVKNKIVMNGMFMSIAICFFVLFWETGKEKILI